MDANENVDSSEQVWEDMILSISKIRWDLINDTDTIELLLAELYEKKICLENLDKEKAEFEKKQEKVTSFSPIESRITILDDYQQLLEEWKNKSVTVSQFLLRFRKEM